MNLAPLGSWAESVPKPGEVILSTSPVTRLMKQTVPTWHGLEKGLW